MVGQWYTKNDFKKDSLVTARLLDDMIEALSENDLDLDAVLPSHYICKWENGQIKASFSSRFPLRRFHSREVQRC